MDGFFTLIALSVVMAIASFLAGILPLAINLSQKRLRLISALGMGVLVGTALVVIIPEGVETLYGSDVGSDVVASHLHMRSPVAHWSREASASALDTASRLSSLAAGAVNGLPGPVIPESLDDPPRTPTEPGVAGILQTEDPDTYPEHEGPHSSSETHHAWVGVALISGFVLMFLIDKVPQYTPSKPQNKTHHISLNNLGRRFNLASNADHDEEAEGFLESGQSPESKGRSFATTTGLVIHAAADGIALGASSSATSRSLSFIIFFAIMLHKAPSAFGLTSILLRQGLSKRMARAHLVLFSLAAPTGALLTWMAARIIQHNSTPNSASTQWWTGVLLLFSAGTFLYVAMHSMQEVLGDHNHDHGTNGHVTMNGTPIDPSRHEQAKPSILDLAAAVFGMVMPLFLQIGHAH